MDGMWRSQYFGVGYEIDNNGNNTIHNFTKIGTDTCLILNG